MRANQENLINGIKAIKDIKAKLERLGETRANERQRNQSHLLKCN